jgi:hypothetical protein
MAAEPALPAAVDPTKNVLDLFAAERRHRDSLRDADNRYQDAMREAETRRINELSAQKQTFDLELARVLRANQNDASTLLATQLKEVKTDLSERTAKLEQFRWEAGGKTDVWRSIPVLIGSLIAVGGLAIAFFK